jgi:S1-C subfamily serine protease
MLKTILKILLIFLFGVGGGVWAQASLLPYLAGYPFFQSMDFIENWGEREVTVNPTHRITVQENTALTDAAEKVEKTVVGVRTETTDGKTLEGSGLVVTSDGLIVTLADLVPQGSKFYFYVDGQWPSYQILKRDLENNLALVKLGKSGLRTAGFADLSRMKIGERVFLLNMVFGEIGTAATGTDSLLPVPILNINEGIISFLSEGRVLTNIFEPGAGGSPLFNIGGEVAGLSMVDKNGRVSVVPVSVVRNFVGF